MLHHLLRDETLKNIFVDMDHDEYVRLMMCLMKVTTVSHCDDGNSDDKFVVLQRVVKPLTCTGRDEDIAQAWIRCFHAALEDLNIDVFDDRFTPVIDRFVRDFGSFLDLNKKNGQRGSCEKDEKLKLNKLYTDVAQELKSESAYSVLDHILKRNEEELSPNVCTELECVRDHLLGCVARKMLEASTLSTSGHAPSNNMCRHELLHMKKHRVKSESSLCCSQP